MRRPSGRWPRKDANPVRELSHRARLVCKLASLLLGMVTAAIFIALGGSRLARPALAAVGHRSTPAGKTATAALAKLPLYFVRNQGQADRRVAYYVQGR